MPDLETVVADWRQRAQMLRSLNHEHDAELIERVVKDVAESAHDYLTWLGEKDARLWSGLELRTLNRRWREMLDAGNARVDAKGHRQWRASALPRRPNIAAAHEAARRGAA